MDIREFENLKKGSLVHCITNYVTVNDVANTILATGGSPIMADAIEEVEEIINICSSLVINIGTLNSRTVESMILAGETANKLGKPVVFDPVGIGASSFRTETSLRLLERIDFAVIRGNASEIKAIVSGNKTSSGVDVGIDDIISEDNLDEYIKIAKEVSKTYKTVAVITGPIDIITDNTSTYIVKNGHANMERITGTGCMLTGLIGSLVGANPTEILESSTIALGMMGLSGELANETMLEEKLGTSSLRTILIDNLSNLDEKTMKEGLRIEIR
nr:hydroxyethylthiazole kinase [Tissierella sp.]